MNRSNKHSSNDKSLSMNCRDVTALAKFYVDTLGFTFFSEENEKTILAFESKPVLELQQSGSTPKSFSLHIGLPSRRELAKVIGRFCTMNQSNTRLELADRQLTKLGDPEGNAIEFFVRKSSNSNVTESPLDIEALFNELLPDDRLCDSLPVSAELFIEEA
jgi:catechol-2,3-dioxygenase